MQKNYDHITEDILYAEWKNSGKMRANNQSKKESFTIPLPPPNVTGQLHLGHAAMLAIEDIMIRFKRMTDHEVLWIPGTDHAAIATENVVLKHLKSKSREEYSREEFLNHCKSFASEKHDTICNQMEKMGAWLDWSREAYTFDSERNFAVNRMFKMLYEDGLIVRGHRMINWSIGAQSVISDDELEYEDVKEPFYYIKCGEFIVGTVRPETKCANSPVVVHPDSEYVKIQINKVEKFIVSKSLLEDKDQFTKVFNLLGEGLKYEILETFKGKDLEGIEFEYDTYAGKRKFHVLSDSVIDPHKGSGAMTISCNHSADDYDLGKRLNLEEFFFDKIDMEGRMTDISGPCQGLSIMEARKKSGKLMEEMGLLVGKDEIYEHRVPLCYRSGCIVEPMISPQWFISVEKEFEVRGKKKSNKIICVRHGESVGNTKRIAGKDPKLTQKGREQAKTTAENLKGKNITKIIVSTLKRAQETVGIIKKELKLDVEIEVWDEVREINYGEFEGKVFERKRESLLEFIKTNKKGENKEDLMKRAKKVKENLARIETDGDILLVSHSTFLSSLFANQQNILAKNFIEFRQNWHMDNAEFKEIEVQQMVNETSNFKKSEQEKYFKNIAEFLDKVTPENWNKICKKLPVGALPKAISDDLGLETNEVFFDNLVYAKICGWRGKNSKFKGHSENPVENFYFLPYLLANPEIFLENIVHKNRYLILTGKKCSFVLVIDIRQKSYPRVVSFFFTTRATMYLNNSKKYKKRYLEGLSLKVPSFTLPRLRRDLARLADRFSSRQVPLCEDIIKIFEENQVFSPEEIQVCENKPQKTTLKKQMQEAVRDGHVKIIPQKFEKEYFRWIDNLRDWCISRQIWWGHQIPVWYDENKNIHLPNEKKLVFARHGQSEANANNIFQGSGIDTPLTEKGRTQAKTLAENLIKSGQKFDVVICSDLLRASETAQIVADKLGIKTIKKWQDLREMSFGNLEGKTKKEVFGTNLTTFVDETPFIFDDNLGDNFEDTINRRQKLIEKLKQENKNILVVSHETTIATIFAAHKFGERLNRESFKLFAESFHLENAGTKAISFFAPPKAEKTQKIIFARHGKTETLKQKLVQSPSDGLNESGVLDAKKLTEKLKSENITKIVSSGYVRALETAKIIGKTIGVDVEILDIFNGYDFGDICGTPIDLNKLAAERATDAGTGETISQFWKRMKKSWEIIKNTKTEGTLLVVAHRTNLCALDTIRNGGSVEDFLETRRGKNNAEFGYWGEIEISSLTQDEDTLDTWFSSALWPFSTVGWDGDKNHTDFQKFYPNSVLETGWDILFFWVARMIMFGKYATGDYPFQTVYLHGMVTDEHGKKMSKSKGNGIDPLDMIKDFGADPIRLALVIGSTPGQKIPIGENKIKGYRNFVNKLWNAGRFVEMQINGKSTYDSTSLVPKSLAEKWILSRFSEISKSVKADLENYQISSAGDKVYHFVWGEFCDWFIEASKINQNPDFLAALYGEILKLVHPLCPFVTEQIWKDLFNKKDELLIEQSFPEIDFQDTTSVIEFQTIQTITNEIRSLRAENKLNPKEKLNISGDISDDQSKKLIESLAGVIFNSDLNKEGQTHKLIIDDIEIIVEIPVDEARLAKEIDNLKKEISALEGRLSNKKYVANAPEKLVIDTKNSLKKAKEKLKKLE